MCQYTFEIEVKDDDLLNTVNSHVITLEADNDEEAFDKFQLIASERGWEMHQSEELIDGEWIPA